jgi:hypothetical protein
MYPLHGSITVAFKEYHDQMKAGMEYLQRIILNWPVSQGQKRWRADMVCNSLLRATSDMKSEIHVFKT